MSPRAPVALEAADGPRAHLRQRASSPALITLLEAAEDAASSFQHDARRTLRPFVQSALEEQAAAPPTPDNGTPGVDDLQEVVRSLGWDPDRLDFSRPLDARELTQKLKAACLSNLHLVGEGSYSMVFRAHNCLDGTHVTLKKLRMDASPDGLPATAVREISLLKELSSCPHIVNMLDVLYDRVSIDAPSRVWLVLEHLDMDLGEYIRRSPGHLDANLVRSITYQLLVGLEAVHSHRVIHRDVKPQNILIDREKGLIKLADFGLSRTCLPAPCGAPPLTAEVVTLLYRAPELLLGCPKYTTAIDLWSTGCVLAELVLGTPLFKGDSEICQLYEIFQLVGTPNDAIWPGVTSLPDWQPLFPKWRPQSLSERLNGQLCPAGGDLLSKLLQLNPDRRLTAAEALQHPYFDSVRSLSN